MSLIGFFGDFTKECSNLETVCLNLDHLQGVAIVTSIEEGLTIRYSLTKAAFFARLQLFLEIAPFMLAKLSTTKAKNIQALGYEAWLQTLKSFKEDISEVGFDVEIWMENVTKSIIAVTDYLQTLPENESIEEARHVRSLIDQSLALTGKLALLIKISNECAQLALLYGDNQEVIRGFERHGVFEKCNRNYLIYKFVQIVQRILSN